jgi:hypothetical protein
MYGSDTIAPFPRDPVERIRGQIEKRQRARERDRPIGLAYVAVAIAVRIFSYSDECLDASFAQAISPRLLVDDPERRTAQGMRDRHEVTVLSVAR